MEWIKIKEIRASGRRFYQKITYTIKDGKQNEIQTKDLCKQAKLANINKKIFNNKEKTMKIERISINNIPSIIWGKK